jgi:hypothetical protein
VSTGAKEDESSTESVWAAVFQYVTARSRFARVETYEPFISLIFKLFSGRGKPRIREHECIYLFIYLLIFIYFTRMSVLQISSIISE